MPCVGVDFDQFQREELKRDQFDLFQIEFSFALLLFLSIAVKDWAKPLRITLIRIILVSDLLGLSRRIHC
jgi:hypothetical protein